jgi:Zn-dependent protease with chaperone function
MIPISRSPDGSACAFKYLVRLLPVLICCLVTGCVTEEDRRHDEGAGANDIRYHQGFQGFHLPPIETIKRASAGNWQFNQPMDEVWKACLDVVSQYQGIISIEKNADGRSLCIIKGRDAQLSPSDQAAETTFGSCYDQWLVIALYDDSGRTAISVAGMDPITGQVRTLPSAEQMLYAQVQIQLSSVPSWNEKYADVDWEKRKPRHVANMSRPAQEMAPEGFEITLGNWIAKRLRLELGLVSCPRVTQSLEIVAQRLKDAAGVSSASTRIHVLGSPNINAFALPNGEIYVTSGLLDSAQSIDEIAAVLAHEIDHLKNRDVASKLHKQAFGEAAANGLRFAWALGQIAMSTIPAGGIGVSLGEDFATAVTGQGIQNGADYLQGGMVEGFSTDIELRADKHGCETLYAAGFDPAANLALLTELNARQGTVLAKKTMAMSNYLNMKPGLDERIEKMKKTLAQLNAGATGSQ